MHACALHKSWPSEISLRVHGMHGTLKRIVMRDNDLTGRALSNVKAGGMDQCKEARWRERVHSKTNKSKSNEAATYALGKHYGDWTNDGWGGKGEHNDDTAWNKYKKYVVGDVFRCARPRWHRIRSAPFRQVGRLPSARPTPARAWRCWSIQGPVPSEPGIYRCRLTNIN